MRALSLVLVLFGALPALAQPEAPTREAEPAPVSSLSRTAPPSKDPFESFRRADGTIDWAQVHDPLLPADQRRLKSFSLESFVRELAVVASTGDRKRIQEFFTGVTATDFYSNYGLFLVGATAADAGFELAYRRYLHRHLKGPFVHGVLRANLTLATGLGLAQIATGNFNGKVFAISMGSLGLSATAVSAAMSRLPFVRKLHVASMAGKATRMLRAGGFVYQTAELALIFFVGRVIEDTYYAWSDRREARLALRLASERCLKAVRGARSEGQLAAALAAYGDAWEAYRNFLYRPLVALRGQLMRELDRIARTSKVNRDRYTALSTRVEKFQNLPLGELAKRTRAAGDAEIAADMDQVAAKFSKSWQATFDAIYTEGRRKRAFVVRSGRNRFVASHARVSGNRLQTYEDQRHALLLLRRELPTGVDSAAVDQALQRASAIRRVDQRLYESDLGLLDLDTKRAARGVGVAGRLERTTRR